MVGCAAEAVCAIAGLPRDRRCEHRAGRMNDEAAIAACTQLVQSRDAPAAVTRAALAGRWCLGGCSAGMVFSVARDTALQRG